MTKHFTDAEAAFLEELTSLTRKHRIAVGGCGCCGSSHLYEIEEAQASGAYDNVERSPCIFEFVAPETGEDG